MRLCPGCGAEVSGRPDKVYCAAICGKRVASARHYRKVVAPRNLARVTRRMECCGCGTAFTTTRAAKRWCSDRCRYEHNYKKRTGRFPPQAFAPTQCRECGESITREQYEAGKAGLSLHYGRCYADYRSRLAAQFRAALMADPARREKYRTYIRRYQQTRRWGPDLQPLAEAIYLLKKEVTNHADR